ncbi:MAG: formylglycine-generating enzyme family protein, partial [Candidatus Omnitrophica bacterium]|nr:formylglycine-generating enzyme family protein [Candidatus Omnitrophota bacterium]
SRAGTQTRFHFGDSLGCDDFSLDCAAGVLPGNRSDYMWYDWSDGTNGFPRGPKVVGSLLPNQWGLYDMHGNLWEWCQDWYHTSYVGAPVDGTAWLSQQPTPPSRVIRGGAWHEIEWSCRSASRYRHWPDHSDALKGFRVVLPVAP